MLSLRVYIRISASFVLISIVLIGSSLLSFVAVAEDVVHYDQRIIQNTDDVVVDPKLKFSSSPVLSFFSESWGNNDLIQKGIIGRAPSGISALVENAPSNLNIEFGQVQHWVFPRQAGREGALSSGGDIRFDKGDDDWEETGLVEIGDDDDDGVEDRRTVFITLNTCLQPSSAASSTSDEAQSPPQLTIYISQSAENQRPGPDGPADRQKEVKLENGYAGVRIKNPSGDIYIGVSASNPSSFSDGNDDVKYEGIYNYEIAASINRPYHLFDGRRSNLFLIDTDSTSALLMTENLVLPSNKDKEATPIDAHVQQEWLNSISVLAYDINSNRSIKGLEHSHCSLLKSQPHPNEHIDKSIPTSSLSGPSSTKPRMQIHLTSLTPNTTYTTHLILTSGTTTTVLFSPLTIRTQPTSFSSSCRIIHSLPFCNRIAYAVPSNPQPLSSSLQETYDNHAASLYKNFTYALAQIACETTPSARYSLARTCDDCAAAYKAWLCAVTIPRCVAAAEGEHPQQDEKEKEWLQHRTPGQSRNEMIDRLIQPGPYTELLPCLDLCWDMVRACPAELGFACPGNGIGMKGFYYDDAQQGKREGRCNNYVGHLGG